MVDPSSVEVVFLDADTGDLVARADIPADQLPESFASATTVSLQDGPWTVVAAEPVDGADFRRSGRLTLRVRRQQEIDPQTILYSVPTICDPLPATVAPEDASSASERLVLHEDDWRRVELVVPGAMPSVREEMAAIDEVLDWHTRRTESGRLIGFARMHLRLQPAEPLGEGLSRKAVLEQCGAPADPVRRLGFLDDRGVVPGSFVVPLGAAELYGVADGDVVHVLGLDLDGLDDEAQAADVAAVLGPLMRRFELTLTDWPHASAVPVEQVGAYLDWLVR